MVRDALELFRRLLRRRSDR